MKAKHWYDYLWVYAIIYFALGFFNILFAWLGMIDFLLPLFLAIFGGNKFFCNHLCGRGQLFSKLGTDLKCSRCKPTPRWMSSKWFRYGFLLFFLTMFGNMVFQTYLVAAGAASLREAIKLFWTFRVPWGWTYTAGTVADWVAQFSFGFYQFRSVVPVVTVCFISFLTRKSASCLPSMTVSYTHLFSICRTAAPSWTVGTISSPCLA